MTIESNLYKRDDPDVEGTKTAEKLDTRTEEQGLQWWQQDEPPSSYRLPLLGRTI